MQESSTAARRRGNMQTIRKLARIQKDIHGAMENCGGVLDITHNGVHLSEQLFRACFPAFRREPLDGNPYATARLVGYWGGVQFYAIVLKKEDPQ